MTPTLFTPAPPSHHKAPGTSAAAAAYIAPHTPSLREQVFAFIAGRGTHGATDEEMQDVLGMGANTQRPRRWELERARRIVMSGERRATRSGCTAAVWIAVQQGEIPESEK